MDINKKLFAIVCILLISITCVSAVRYSFDNNDKLGIFNVTNAHRINASVIQVGELDVCLSDGTNCAGGTGDNASWNESYANTLYAVIEWGYNQTLGIDVTYVEGLGFVTGAHTVDTNETARFIELTTNNCSGSSKMVGVYANGTVNCEAVAGGGDFSFSDFQAAFNLNWTALDYDKWMYNMTEAGDNRFVNIDGDTMTGNLSNSEWFNGKFNWTVGDDWAYFDGSSWTFNESMLATIYYNATQVQVVEGTTQGDLSYTNHKDGHYDGLSYNITESAGSPGLDIRFNFTNGITDFTQGIIRYKAPTIFGGGAIIQLWDYVDEEWEDYPTLTESPTFVTVEQSVFDSTTHVQDGTVQMRLYKSANGNTNNKYEIDWLAIAKGFGTPAGEEIDPFGIHKDGTSTVTANIPFGNFNLTAGWFKGLFNWTTLTNWLSFDGATLSFNDTRLNNTILDVASVYNNTDLINSSFNQALTDTLYADIQWNYNQTIPAIDYTDTSSGNLQANITLFNSTLYDLFIDFNYNQTIATFNQYGQWWYNMTTPANEYTDAMALANNDSWLSTYNATYDSYAYNQTLAGDNRFVNIDGDTMTDNLSMGADDIGTCYGASGCADSSIYFNGSGLTIVVN